MNWFERKSVSPQQAGVLFAVIFIFVWVLSESFWAAFFLGVLALLRIPGLWKTLLKARKSETRYHVGSFDPFADELDEDRALESMPRYSQGRVLPTSAPPPTRTYEADDEDDDAPVAAEPVRATPRFGATKMPPRKPVDLPRHRR